MALDKRYRGEPWNKGKLVGQKAPLRLKEIWAIRIRLQLAERTRELALFNLAIDSKLRSCDLVTLRVRDITHGERIAARAIVMQQKTQRPVQFEITEQTRDSVTTWIRLSHLRLKDYLFPSRIRSSAHLSTRQYARIVHQWVQEIGLNSAAYGTHTLRRSKASLIYRRTKNLRAVQLLLGQDAAWSASLDPETLTKTGRFIKYDVARCSSNSRWLSRDQECIGGKCRSIQRRSKSTKLTERQRTGPAIS
jgi:integrase